MSLNAAEDKLTGAANLAVLPVHASPLDYDGHLMEWSFRGLNGER
jgi:hypothetical protein